MGILVSMGGLIFGYDTGQISGFLEMKDFLDRFGQNGKFTNVRSGLIVGMVSLGVMASADKRTHLLTDTAIHRYFGRRPDCSSLRQYFREEAFHFCVVSGLLRWGYNTDIC